MRLWTIATGQEIASFVSFTDGGWIVITPEGYYRASDGGHQHVNARIGNAVYDIDQFSETFHRPDLIEKKLKGEDLGRMSSRP